MSIIDTEIKKIIEDVTCNKYIGKLHVTKENYNKESNTAFWTLFLYLDTDYSPLILAYDGTYEKFKSFVVTELKQRKLHYIQFWNTLQERAADNYCNE